MAEQQETNPRSQTRRNERELAIGAATIVQAITAVIIAVATIVYTRMSVKMFQAGIDPDGCVAISGSLDQNSISVHNNSGCAVSEFSVSASVGAMKDGEEYPVCRCVFLHTWPTLGPGLKWNPNASNLARILVG